MKKIKKLSDLTKKQLASLIDDFFDNHPDFRYYDHYKFKDRLSISKEDLIEIVINLYDITILDSGFIYIVEKKL